MAYRFWEKIQQELDRQRMDQRTLVSRSGVPASTINRLRTGSRAPAARIVDALARALGIDYDEARYLAGRPAAVAPDAEPDPVDVREAIRNSPVFSEEQKRTLLQMAETFERLNAAQPSDVGRTAGGAANRTA